MNKEILYNKKSRDQLKQELDAETFDRITCSFYRYMDIEEPIHFRDALYREWNRLKILGRVYVAKEGINATIAGNSKDISNIVKYIKLILNIKKFDIENITYSSFIPFLKAKVKIKNEVVPMDYNFSFKNKITKNYLSPKKWDNLLSQKNVKIVDARKPFEYEVGTFKGAINPNTYNFREFKTYLSNLDKKQKIGMFCTGGIRCEKASNYLHNNGFKNVYMLKGGIINYFNKTDPKKSNWKGECFVFDNRVTIKKDKKSKYYKIGLSCPKCYDKLTSSQITRFTVRHKQLLNKKIPLIYKRK